MKGSTIDDDTPWYLKDLIIEKGDNEEEELVLAPSKSRTGHEEEHKNILESNVKDFHEIRSTNKHHDKNYNIESIYFKPFKGSENDLINLLGKSPDQHMLKDNNGEKLQTLLDHMKLKGSLYILLFGALGCTIFVILRTIRKGRIKALSESVYNQVVHILNGEIYNSIRDDATDTDDVNITTQKTKIETTTSLSINTHNKRDIKGFFSKHDEDDDSDSGNDHDKNDGKGLVKNDYEKDQVKNSGQKELDPLLCIDNPRKRDLNGFFLNDIPALANVVSRSGLDKQEAIKIVTREVFETNRRNAEEQRKDQKETQRRLELKVTEADDKLVEIIGSTFSGSHFLLCILLGCGTRFVCSHADSVRQFFFMDDPPYVFDSAFDWFSVNICGCLETDDIDNSYQINSLHSSSWWLGILMPYFSTSFSSIINTSPIFGRCLVKIASCAILISIIHRLLRIFHFPALHHIMNLFIFLVTIVNTSFGRSIMMLILQIFVINAITCCVGYCCYLSRKDISEVVGVESNNDETAIEQFYRTTLIETRQLKWKIYIGSTGSAIILGLVSFIVIKS